MTTTAFRMDSESVARMGSDSRVSWIDSYGLVAKVADSQDYYKVANINDVLFGFAGTNSMYRVFLENYGQAVTDSTTLLDTLVAYASLNRIQFSMLRFDGELREFAYSPPDSEGNNKIFLDSKSGVLNTKMYAIGSGKESKAYKSKRLNPMVCFPIKRIIGANSIALSKNKFKEVRAKLNGTPLTQDEARDIYRACRKAGGDIFTGGEVRVMERSKNITTAQKAAEQVKILNDLDSQAKSQGLICASPINAEKEISQLKSLGVNPVRPGGIDPEIQKSELFSSISRSLNGAF